jgi:hypothetical protein
MPLLSSFFTAAVALLAGVRVVGAQLNTTVGPTTSLSAKQYVVKFTLSRKTDRCAQDQDM